VHPRLIATLLIVALIFAAGVTLSASTVAVQYPEGSVHGFLLLSTMDGTPLAAGDLLQSVHRNQITARLVFHFKDGSLQDETTVFTQRSSFSLVSYHMIQKGPAFSRPTELSIASSGQVTVRYTDDKGEEKIENQHLKLPSDLANGLVLILLKNLRPKDPLPQFSMVVATPKPRIVKLSLMSDGNEPLSLGGVKREAMHYVIKVQIGGVAGVVAPLIGKQPPDASVWIMHGDMPAFVKSETLSYSGGPLWRTELLSPTWPKSASSESKEAPSAKQ
jgi:hypothetical protein